MVESTRSQPLDRVGNCVPTVDVETNCDGIDNDCDDFIDEGLLLTFYRDADNDLFGDPDNTVEACSAPEGSYRCTLPNSAILKGRSR